MGKHDQVCRLGIVQEFAEGAEELLEQLVKMIGRYIHTQNLGRDEMHLLQECLHRIFKIEIYVYLMSLISTATYMSIDISLKIRKFNSYLSISSSVNKSPV